MQIRYRNKRLERALICIKALASAVVVASFVVMFGFERPLLPASIVYRLQIGLLCIFVLGKSVRFLNAEQVKEFLIANWLEIPLLIGLGVAVAGSIRWSGRFEPASVRHFAVGIYLVIEVITKVCRTVVDLAATGRNPTQTLIASFLVLIIAGAAALSLPRSSAGERIGVVDALFTATSATCVTGLIVKDTGRDFSLMGQIVILTLIQLGGLGIVVFGAVLALLLGQALSLRESVAMQDLLSARTLNRIGRMIGFIFVFTVFIEAVGALGLWGMWDDVPGRVTDIRQQWFCSIFHSISAFCNAGFSLFSDSFIGYNRSWGVYLVICPLIVFGGLGFGVLYDLVNLAADRVKRFFMKLFSKRYRFSMAAAQRMQLQSKIVLVVSFALIIVGASAILLFERYASGGNPATPRTDIAGALFQSITARTAGFNTVNVSEFSSSSRFILILLMFIGGSPGSTAGGIKTVTLAVVIMTAVAALRKRSEVEMFSRSVRVVVVGRAITVVLFFAAVLFAASLALSITENGSGFTMADIMFEAASALGTVGLTAGITPSLTAAGKIIIILVMLIGRLGPLTLLAVLTFNIKPARYNYPQEAVIVG